MHEDTADAAHLQQLAAVAALGGRSALTDEQARVLDEAVNRDPSLAAELADLRAFVSTFPPAPGEDLDLTLPPGLRESVVARVRQERARSGRTQALARVLSVAAAVVLGVGLGRVTVPEPPGPPVEQIALGVDTLLASQVGVIAHTWGTELVLALDGTVSGETYRVAVTASSGEVFEAGTFIGDASRTVLCEMNVALLRPDAASFAVLDAAGEIVTAGALPDTTSALGR